MPHSLVATLQCSSLRYLSSVAINIQWALNWLSIKVAAFVCMWQYDKSEKQTHSVLHNHYCYSMRIIIIARWCYIIIIVMSCCIITIVIRCRVIIIVMSCCIIRCCQWVTLCRILSQQSLKNKIAFYTTHDVHITWLPTLWPSTTYVLVGSVSRRRQQRIT